MATQYRVNEVYRSIQGEGHRVGTHNVFLRFTGCNMRCEMAAGEKSPGGFDCDTEFASGRDFTLSALCDWIEEEDTLDGPPCKWVIATGGEPGLQLDDALVDELHKREYQIAVETNGSVILPKDCDYIAVSPKVAEHCIRQRRADEVRYVRGYGQALPRTTVNATHYFLSPAFNGNTIDERTLKWVKQLCETSHWRLSVQLHKVTGHR